VNFSLRDQVKVERFLLQMRTGALLEKLRLFLLIRRACIVAVAGHG